MATLVENFFKNRGLGITPLREGIIDFDSAGEFVKKGKERISSLSGDALEEYNNLKKRQQELRIQYDEIGRELLNISNRLHDIEYT